MFPNISFFLCFFLTYLFLREQTAPFPDWKSLEAPKPGFLVVLVYFMLQYFVFLMHNYLCSVNHRFYCILVHGQVTIIFVVSVCLFVCLCRVFLSSL